MDEPTRGIDVGAKRDIYPLMGEASLKDVHLYEISGEYSGPGFEEVRKAW